jgi:methylenetetrahydrofolate dehydrogenase (NADP+)/methenyltetrahydrofolate cyclohydrolase
VGDNPVSAQYVRLKAKKAGEAGLRFLQADFPKETSTELLLEEIKKLNKIPYISGLIAQLPLPKNIDQALVLNSIDPLIDVDCMGKARNEKFYSGDLEIVPPTAGAIMHILDSLKLDLASKNILVVGQGELVGRPVLFLLRNRGYSISTVNKDSTNTEEQLLAADIIISGTGKPKLITGDKVKKGVVIIDAGTAEDGGEIVGDVELESVKEKALAGSPVPGGVGPVTVAMLLANVVKVAKQQEPRTK